MELKNIFDAKKFEELLVTKWTQFLDANKLLRIINDLVMQHKDTFEIIPNTTYKQKGIQIMVSRFQNTEHGFIIWIDFIVPLQENKVAVGTTEMFLLPIGILSHSKTLGNIYNCN